MGKLTVKFLEIKIWKNVACIYVNKPTWEKTFKNHLSPHLQLQVFWGLYKYRVESVLVCNITWMGRIYRHQSKSTSMAKFLENGNGFWLVPRLLSIKMGLEFDICSRFSSFTVVGLDSILGITGWIRMDGFSSSMKLSGRSKWDEVIYFFCISHGIFDEPFPHL